MHIDGWVDGLIAEYQRSVLARLMWHPVSGTLRHGAPQDAMNTFCSKFKELHEKAVSQSCPAHPLIYIYIYMYLSLSIYICQYVNIH